MKRFTVGERRGTIVVLSAMTLLAAFLIFNKGQQLQTPALQTDSAQTVETAVIVEPDSIQAKPKKEKKKTGSSRRQSAKKTTGSGTSRNHLDEGV